MGDGGVGGGLRVTVIGEPLAWYEAGRLIRCSNQGLGSFPKTSFAASGRQYLPATVAAGRPTPLHGGTRKVEDPVHGLADLGMSNRIKGVAHIRDEDETTILPIVDVEVERGTGVPVMAIRSGCHKGA